MSIDRERLRDAMMRHLISWQEPDGQFKRGHARCNEACVPELADAYEAAPGDSGERIGCSCGDIFDDEAAFHEHRRLVHEGTNGDSLDVERLADALPSVLNFRLTIRPVGHPRWRELAEEIAAAYATRTPGAPES